MQLPQIEIAVVFDFDITVTPSYMQRPIFDKYGINEKSFWDKVNALKIYGYDDEHAYLKMIQKFIVSGQIEKLSNADLKLMGADIEFYEGFPLILDDLKKIPEIINTDNRYINPIVRFYVISSGLYEIIAGSKAAPYLTKFWGCTLDEDKDGNIAFPKETISHTGKTQKLFLINKGLLNDGDQVKVNDYFDEKDRPVPFKHMIYVGDGATDVPCFSLIQQNGGRTIAVYNPGNQDAIDRCYRLVVEQKRADLMCSADYKKNGQLYLALTGMVRSISEQILSANNN